MLITAWVMFVFFGLFGLYTSAQYFLKNKSLGVFHALIWFFSIIVTAVSAGIIWGGLFSNVG